MTQLTVSGFLVDLPCPLHIECSFFFSLSNRDRFGRASVSFHHQINWTQHQKLRNIWIHSVCFPFDPSFLVTCQSSWNSTTYGKCGRISHTQMPATRAEQEIKKKLFYKKKTKEGKEEKKYIYIWPGLNDHALSESDLTEWSADRLHPAFIRFIRLTKDFWVVQPLDRSRGTVTKCKQRLLATDEGSIHERSETEMMHFFFEVNHWGSSGVTGWQTTWSISIFQTFAFRIYEV